MKIDEFELVECETIPPNIEDGRLYYSRKYGTATHLCACAAHRWHSWRRYALILEAWAIYQACHKFGWIAIPSYSLDFPVCI